MTGSLEFVAATALAGGIIGLVLARRLASARYRIGDETDRPLPRAPWLVAPAVCLTWAALAWRLGGLGGAALLPAYLLFAAVGVALVWIDLDVHRLPEGLTLPTVPALLGLLTIGAVSVQQPRLVLSALVAGAASWAGYAGLSVVSRGALGWGDATLGGLVGMLLGPFGWERVVAGFLGSFLVGGLLVVLGLATGRLTLRSHVAFGPAIAAAGLLAVLAG